jgi:hypothetical protein
MRVAPAVRARPPLFAALLSLSLALLVAPPIDEVHNTVVEIASHDLRELVSRRISPPQSSPQRPAGVGYSQGVNIGDPKLSLALQNVNVRQVLDNMALASDRKIGS